MSLPVPPHKPPKHPPTVESPYEVAASQHKKAYTPTVKAYKNEEFLNSSQARMLRIMCEYEETMLRLKRYKIRATILVFGSARAKSREDVEEAVAAAHAAVDAAHDAASKQKATAALARLEKTAWMGVMTEKITELSRLLTEWAVSDKCQLGREHIYSGVTRYHYTDPAYATHPRTLGKNVPSYGVIGDLEGPLDQGVYICTGGGPGFMEAANKGAAMVPGSKNIGMGITLPFEEGLNEYVTPELAFEYHYFFSRKLYMVYHCQALVAAPGGFGTMDELFEVLTLKQTSKIQKTLPVVLFGKKYWETVVNWQSLVDFGTIAQEDVDSLFFTDSAEDAFKYLVDCLSKTNSA